MNYNKNKLNNKILITYLVIIPFIAITAMMSTIILNFYWVLFTLIAIIIAFTNK